VKTTLGTLQNILFRSNRNKMQEEFKTLKNSLFTIASFFTIHHHLFTNSAG